MIYKLKELSRIDGKVNILLVLLLVGIIAVKPATIMFYIVKGEPISIWKVMAVLTNLIWIKTIDYQKFGISSNNQITILAIIMVIACIYSEFASTLITTLLGY